MQIAFQIMIILLDSISACVNGDLSFLYIVSILDDAYMSFIDLDAIDDIYFNISITSL
mgnify:CR=1 FL=1